MNRFLIFLFAIFISGFSLGQDASTMEEIELTIYFENDSYELANIYQATLDSLITSKKIIQYKTIGFASNTGKRKHNIELSISRAKTVGDYLANKNILGEQEGKGAIRNTLLSIDEQRRVELIIYCEVKQTIELKPIPTIVNKDLISKDSLLSIIEQTDTISLKSIQFFGGQAIFYPTELPPKDLYYLAEIMTANPTMKISIQGHVCCGHDLRLSERRAEAVYYVLKKEGIAAARMEVIGFSNTRLKVPDTTPQNNQTNRRVEIIITTR